MYTQTMLMCHAKPITCCTLCSVRVPYVREKPAEYSGVQQLCRSIDGRHRKMHIGSYDPHPHKRSTICIVFFSKRASSCQTAPAHTKQHPSTREKHPNPMHLMYSIAQTHRRRRETQMESLRRLRLKPQKFAHVHAYK